MNVEIDGRRLDPGVFHVEANDITGVDSMPASAVETLLGLLALRKRGIRDGTRLDSDPILRAIANELAHQEWVSGRRLRKATGFDVTAFHQSLTRLMPRYVRRDGINENDTYSLTLPGLLLVDAQLRSIDIAESIYRAVARKYDENEETERFDDADLVACGVDAAAVPLARTIARICLLVGGGAASERALRLPADREMIAAQSRKQMRFVEYLHYAATEKQRNAHFAVSRPWPQAPLTLEQDGSQTDYVPMEFFAYAPLSSEVVGDDHRDEAAAATQDARLPRLDVKYREKLGDGAFGTVWAAVDVLLDRPLAVKFLTMTDEAVDEEALLRQARSLAKVTHANLVVVYGAAWLRHPVHGLVVPAIMMELLRGEPLHPWFTVEHDRSSVLRVATGLLSGIAAMHEAGLHHGDLHAKNVIVLANGHCKVIDWRYQDTFVAKSTASRAALMEADERHAIDLVVSMFEKQGLKDESIELRRVSGIAAALAAVDRIATPASSTPTQAVVAEPDAFPPAPSRLDRTGVNDNEKSEDQSELAIWPADDSDLDASELVSELDALVRDGTTVAPIQLLLGKSPAKTPSGLRWILTSRPYGNVIQKWELEVRDRGFIAFRWAKFTTHGGQALYETRELLDGTVVPIYLYEHATAATRAMGAAQVGRIRCRLTVVGSQRLVLHDDARVLVTQSAPKADAGTFSAQLEAQIPGQPGGIAARLINRMLSNFHVERPWQNERGPAPILRLNTLAFEEYLQSAGLKRSAE